MQAQCTKSALPVVAASIPQFGEREPVGIGHHQLSDSVNLQAGERQSAMPMPPIRVARGELSSRRCPLILLTDEHGERVRLGIDGEIAHPEQPIRR
jgi:hypothetical protein